MSTNWECHTSDVQTSASPAPEDTGKFRAHLDRELDALRPGAITWVDAPPAPRARRWTWFAVFTLGVLVGFYMAGRLVH